MVDESKNKLVEVVSHMAVVKGIAQTGDMNAVLIPHQSDIDLFVLCDSIPSKADRINCYEQYKTIYSNCIMNVCEGYLWGTGDILIIDDIDVMFMYFTIDEMTQYLSSVLDGKHLQKEGDFYPTARLESVETINVLYEEENTWTKIIDMVKNPDTKLFDTLYQVHRELILDEESIGRSLLRKDVLFYHQVLENAIEHYLQALFAMNKSYYPGRKKNKDRISQLDDIPEDCFMRIIQTIQDAANEATICDSIDGLQKLVKDMDEIVHNRS